MIQIYCKITDTGCLIFNKALRFLENYGDTEKCFKQKLYHSEEDKKVLLIDWVASSRSHQFFLTPNFFMAESNSWCREFFKTL